jgi:hypothetical protein
MVDLHDALTDLEKLATVAVLHVLIKYSIYAYLYASHDANSFRVIRQGQLGIENTLSHIVKQRLHRIIHTHMQGFNV